MAVMPTISRRQPHPTLPSRGASVYYGLLFMLVGVLVILSIAWPFLPKTLWGDESSGPVMHVVSEGEFIHEITERGEVESASNVEIRCEVQSQGSSGIMILEIVEEGTYVKKGEVLAKLDSSSLENQQTQQQIVCNTSDAVVIQVKNDYDTAVIAKREYLEGTFIQEEQNLQSAVFVAEEDLRRARQYLQYSQGLKDKGYVTDSQLEADQFAVQKAEKELDSAKTKLMVLREFTKKKMEMQLEANIGTAKAKWDAEQKSHELDVEKLALIESQLKKCIVIAPDSGQVVYANQSNRWGSSEVIIEPGSLVRERQVIIRLPDPKRMQVKAKINEARVTLVSPEMSAVIRLDAFPDAKLTGSVLKINDYPAPTSWHSSNVKEYETRISIDESIPGLRPGLTAEVKVLVDRIPKVIHVPVQTVLEHGGKHYCAQFDGKRWKAREVTIGATNDKTVLIESGLKVGEPIVMGVIAYLDKLDLPDLPPEKKEKSDAKPDTSKKPSKSESKSPSSAQQPSRSKRTDSKSDGGGHPESGRPGSGRPGGSGRPSPAKMFKGMDKDGNGKLDASEIPEMMKSRLSEVDTNSDGEIDLAEFNAMIKKFQSARGGGGRGAPGRPRSGQGGGGGGGSGGGHP